LNVDSRRVARYGGTRGLHSELKIILMYIGIACLTKKLLPEWGKDCMKEEEF
jgi:hypothetical protein